MQCSAVRQLLVLSTLVASGSIASAEDRDVPVSRAEVGKPAPDFVLSNTDGKEVRLSDYADRIVVLEWFNQDCPACAFAMPVMKELSDQYTQKDVVWLAVDSTYYQTADRNNEYRKKKSLTYPILMDSDGTVGRMYGAKNTPQMFVVRKGIVVYAGALDNGGFRTRGDRNYVCEALDAALKGEDPPISSTRPYGCRIRYARKPNG